MKEKVREIELKNSTFTNFNITNKKSNLSSKINQMNATEYNDIKLITTNFIPPQIKANKTLKEKIDKFKFITNKNNLNFPLMQMTKPKLNNININSNPSLSNVKSKTLMSTYNKNLPKRILISLNKRNNNVKKSDIDNPFKIVNNTINNNFLSVEKKGIKKFIIKNNNKNESFTNFTKNIKSSINFEENTNKNFHYNNSQKHSNKRNPIEVNNISPNNKYSITTNNFISSYGSLTKNMPNKGINKFLYKTNNNNFSSTKSFKNRNYNLSHNPHKFIKASNNSYKGINKSNNNIFKIKKMPRTNLNYWKLLELENKFNEAYINNRSDVNEKNRDIKKIKEKCKIILKELDKKNNFEIQHIIKEINNQLLGLNFNDFYNYLLTILKNYDKKIANWSFDIMEDKKECPEELKFKNVRHRHQKFMGLVDRQYVCGINANNHMDYLIKNSKSKLGFNNNDNYDNINLNNKSHQDNFIDNVFTENNYRSKFYEKILRNKSNNIDS